MFYPFSYDMTAGQKLLRAPLFLVMLPLHMIAFTFHLVLGPIINAIKLPIDAKKNMARVKDMANRQLGQLGDMLAGPAREFSNNFLDSRLKTEAYYQGCVETYSHSKLEHTLWADPTAAPTEEQWRQAENEMGRNIREARNDFFNRDVRDAWRQQRGFGPY